MTDLDRPLLVFDGDCRFCRGWIARWRRATGDAVDYAPSQAVADRFPDIAPARFRESVVLIEPDGRVSSGAEAVFRSLARAPGRGLALDAYERVPGFAAASEWCYRLVARNRGPFSFLTLLLWGEHVDPPGDRLTVWLFLRLLALVYLAAFASLGVQILGLAGRQGILPIAPLLDSVARGYGPERFMLLPTLCWWNASDASLLLQCGAGIAAALALFAGLAPAVMLALAWGLYLSLATAGQEFLWFQWDSLLLETGFLALFLAPLRWRSGPGRDPAPSRAAVWMFRWLLFRLMFASAVVKLSSGDPTWRDLSALRYHFETQPLPPWTAWYAHHLPAAVLRGATLATLAIEGLVPFLVVLPRRPRRLAALVLAGLQTLILLTGNYGFFNLLSIVLCVLLLDDAAWPAWLRRRWEHGPIGEAGRGRWPAAITRPVLACLFLLGVVPLVRSFRQPAEWLTPLYRVYRALSPLQLANSYGLFAVMTTARPEIVVEGSDDLETWKPYEFRWKPGDLRRRPGFMAPHMPRLDWRMWFAALDTTRLDRWYLGFCGRLLEGSPPVVRLLARDPFPGHPPRYVRGLVYDYRFTSAFARDSTGAWWTRRLTGAYGPVLTLERGNLAPVRPAVPGVGPGE